MSVGIQAGTLSGAFCTLKLIFFRGNRKFEPKLDDTDDTGMNNYVIREREIFIRKH